VVTCFSFVVYTTTMPRLDYGVDPENDEDDLRAYLRML